MNLRLARIQSEVLGWPGVQARTHRFGGVEFVLGRREIGHVHGATLLDVPLPRRVRDAFIESGRARPHHVLPDSGWVSVHLASAEDVDNALAVLKAS